MEGERPFPIPIARTKPKAPTVGDATSLSFKADQSNPGQPPLGSLNSSSL